MSREATAAAPTAEPLLTVAICTRNRAALLREAAESVIRQVEDNTQVLIVDSASTDSTLQAGEALAAAHACVRVVPEPRVGLSHARNTALAAARSRYVIFLDDDALAKPGWLAAYRRFLERPPAEDIAAAFQTKRARASLRYGWGQICAGGSDPAGRFASTVSQRKRDNQNWTRTSFQWPHLNVS